MTDRERAHFPNLILLCRPHHLIVDKIRPEDYPADLLDNWKLQREGPDLADAGRDGAHPVAQWLSRGDHIRTPPLPLPVDHSFASPPISGRLTPYQALWPRFGLVPFTDHAGVLAELEDWCQAPDALSAIFVDGVGGAGKTRTAVEICKRLQRSAWIAGFFRYGAVAPGAALDSQHTNRLIVFDYANDRPNQIQALLDDIVSAVRSDGRKTRFLLITRNGSRTRAMSRLTAHQSESSYLLDSARTLSLQPDSSGFNLTTRQFLYESARASFGTILATSAPSDHERPDLAADTYSTPLFVVLAALLSVYSEDIPAAATRDEILERILAREAELFWSGSPEPDLELRDATVCVSTIAHAESEREIVRRLSSIGYGATDLVTRRIANWLHSLYPGPHWANGLEPDLLGEYLILNRVPSQLAAHIAIEGSLKEVSSMLRALGRVAAGWPGSDVRGSLREVVETFPGIIPSWISAERDGDVLASDVLDSATEFLEQIPEVLRLPHIEIPGRLGPGGDRFAAAASRRWYQEAGRPPDERWLLGVSLAGRLLRSKQRDETLALVQQLHRDPASNRTELQFRTASIQLLSYQARASASAKSGMPALERAMDILAAIPQDERGDVTGLEASIHQQYADLLISIALFQEAFASLDKAVALRRDAVLCLGEVHVPALAASLRSRASNHHRIGGTQLAVADIVEAISLLRDFAVGSVSVYEKDLARCYEVAARIMQSQDVSLATSYARESLDSRTRLAEVFGIDSRLELLSALVRVAQTSQDEQYFDRAVDLMSAIVSTEELSAPQSAELEALGRRLSSIASSAKAAQRVGAIVAELTQNDSVRAAKFQLNLARICARGEDVEGALMHFRSAAAEDGAGGLALRVQRLPNLLKELSAARTSERYLAELDTLVAEACELLIAHDLAPFLKARPMLVTFTYACGWLGQAEGYERLVALARPVIDDRADFLVHQGAIRGHLAASMKRRGIERGREARQQISKAVRADQEVYPRHPRTGASPRRRALSQPLAGDPRLVALRAELQRREDGGP